jgi:hypothetical protein
MVFKTWQDTLSFCTWNKTKRSPSPTDEILWQTKELQKVTYRFCKDYNSCEPTWFELVVIQNDQVDQVNNLSILQGGTYRKRVGNSIEFNEKTPSRKRCLLSRFEKLFSSENKTSASKTINQCEICSNWWIDDNNTTGWIQKPPFYPTVSCTNFGDSTPSLPKGCEITNKNILAPCKISFSFLLQVYKYAKFQYLSKDSWIQAMTKVYLCTCCMSGDVSNKFFITANTSSKNDAPKTIVTPPVLWLQHKELGIKIEHFSDALMHMLF